MRDFGEVWNELTPGQLKKRVFKWIVILIFSIMGISVLGFVTGIISLPFRSARGVAEKVLAPEAIIGNYQWYYDQYNQILAQKANLDALDETTRERPGLLMALNGMIGEYNSRSKQITRNLWKAVDLPYQISMEDGK